MWVDLYTWLTALVTDVVETRNSSGDEIANVNFYYDDIVHALQNTYTRAWVPPQIDAICVRTQAYHIQWNNAMQRPLRRSRSFKVTDYGTNRKLVYDFLLVTYLLSCTVSKLWLIIGQIFASERSLKMTVMKWRSNLWN